MTPTDATPLETILADHYQTKGERREHPRFGLDTPYDVPGTTDYECAACHNAWPCDVSLIAALPSPLRQEGVSELSQAVEAVVRHLDKGVFPQTDADIAWLRAVVAVYESVDEGLRAAGDGYEIQTWVRHEPSGLVVLKGHPQLGGRYCMTDGGDWPCASVRAALTATQPATGGEG